MISYRGSPFFQIKIALIHLFDSCFRLKIASCFCGNCSQENNRKLGVLVFLVVSEDKSGVITFHHQIKNGQIRPMGLRGIY
jgi:hypothetical protein